MLDTKGDREIHIRMKDLYSPKKSDRRNQSHDQPGVSCGVGPACSFDAIRSNLVDPSSV